MQCFFLGLKICGSKINATMFVIKSLFTLTTGMILRAVMSSSACQQLQASSATADPELDKLGAGAVRRSGEVPGEPRGEDKEKELCCSEV